VANNFVKNVTGFVAHFTWLPFVVALALTLGWIYLLAPLRRAQPAACLRWAAGGRWCGACSRR